MEPAPTPVSMKGSLPLPQDRISWLVAGLLVGVLLAAYYGLFYNRLEDANNNAYTFNEPQISKDPPPVKLEVASPNSISSLSRQTFYLSVTNTEAMTVTVRVVPKLEVNEADSADYYVFLDTPDGSQPTLQQGGYLLFSDIPPLARISQALTVQLLGLNQATEADAIPTNGQSGTAGDSTPTPTPTKEPLDEASFSLATPAPTKEPVETVSVKFTIWHDNTSYDVSFENSSAMEVDSLRAVAQGIMSFLLLPPWANGFIPFVAVFIVYLFGLPEALRHCFPPSRPKRPFVKSVWAIVKFIFWLFLMGSVAVLALWAMTEIAVFVLSKESWSLATAAQRAIVSRPAVLALAVALLAWVIDWCIIRSPDAPTPANNPNSTRTPETLTVNAAAITIQSPDGQPLTMPVHAGALTVQLNGELFQHCAPHPCHQPATPPQAASDALPVEQPALVVVPAAPRIEPVAVSPPADQAEPVIVPIVPPAALAEIAPPNPELLALMAQVRQLETELAAQRATLQAPPSADSAADAAPLPDAAIPQPPAPDPAAADAAPPDAPTPARPRRQRNPKPPEIPEQPPTLADQAAVIFEPPQPGAVPPLAPADAPPDAAEPPPDAPANDPPPPRQEPF